MADLIHIGCDETIKLTGLKATDSGLYLNSATVTWNLTKSDGTSLATGPLSYVADSDGNYMGVIESSATEGLVFGKEYTIIVIIASGNYNDERRLTRRAAYRLDR